MLSILYKDEHYVAIHKPAGLLVHRSPIAKDATEFALQMVRDQVGHWVYPVHRLDGRTSGVLVFGLTRDAASKLADLFRLREVQKIYWAVVRGYAEEEDVIDYALKRSDFKPRQSAVTAYRRLATTELPIPVGPYQTARYSLVEVMPKTGRLHQIRKHFAHVFHPVLGDRKHGDWRHNKMAVNELEIEEMLLLSKKLCFVHPYTGIDVAIETTLPDFMIRGFKRFGWQHLLTEEELNRPLLPSFEAENGHTASTPPSPDLDGKLERDEEE